MTWAVVVLDGPNINQTLASIWFDRWGQKTHQSVMVCSDWTTGYQQARQHHSHALFVDSGTYFRDWLQWKELLDNYPHRGLIGHIIYRPGQTMRLDSQCWFMDLERFSFDIPGTITYAPPQRSERDIHDDYTPLWLRPGSEGKVTHACDGFGQHWMSQQLNSGLPVVNWNHRARDLKTYLYRDEQLPEVSREYVELAESQFWVTNNEPVRRLSKSRILCPGSGLFWLLNLVDDATSAVQIVDISATQIGFCRSLWREWDGRDYGRFAWEFIQRHQLMHFELDRPDADQGYRERLRQKDRFIEHVDDYFNQVMGINHSSFGPIWQRLRREKSLDLHHGDLVQWVLDHDGLGGCDAVWCSNILNYKWTLLHHTPRELDRFKELVS